jgi:hypothetical protein
LPFSFVGIVNTAVPCLPLLYLLRTSERNNDFDAVDNNPKNYALNMVPPELYNSHIWERNWESKSEEKSRWKTHLVLKNGTFLTKTY